jgi:hypothetical protein
MYLNHDACRRSTLFNVYSVTNANDCAENTCCTRCTTADHGIVTDECTDLSGNGVDGWKARFVFESDPTTNTDITSKDNSYVV